MGLVQSLVRRLGNLLRYALAPCARTRKFVAARVASRTQHDASGSRVGSRGKSPDVALLRSWLPSPAEDGAACRYRARCAGSCSLASLALPSILIMTAPFQKSLLRPPIDLHGDAHELGEVLRADALHHPGAVVFYGFRADIKLRSDFLVRQPGDRKFHHLALPRRQHLEARSQPFDFRRIFCLLASDRHRVANAGEKAALVERLFDEIERPELDGGDRHVDIAKTSDQDDRRDRSARIEAMDKIEARHSWHANIGHDAVGPGAAVECGEKCFC